MWPFRVVLSSPSLNDNPRFEQRVEDPLAEELLRGAFEGKNTIVVEAIKDSDGKITRLEFKGEVRDQTEAVEPAAAAGA